MPPIDPPDQTQANGTRKKAIGWRVETPSSKPFPRRVSQVPLGGRERSTGVDEVATASEKLEVTPQRRQRAISVETFTSASGISALQLGQIALELIMLVKVTAYPIHRHSRDRSQSSQHRSQVSLFFSRCCVIVPKYTEGLRFMAKCNFCDSRIFVGGLRVEDRRFCNQKCLEGARDLALSRSIPAEVVLTRTSQVYNGSCPVCGGRGPVDVHKSYKVWSALFL